VQTILYFIQENLKQYYKQQQSVPQALQRRQHQVEGQDIGGPVSAAGSPLAFMSYGQQAPTVSASIKKRMSYKAQRQSMRGNSMSNVPAGAMHPNDFVFGSQAFSPGSPGDIYKHGLLKLRPEYQVYIAQMLQIAGITAFECDYLPQIYAQNQHLTISALNLNLQLQNINNLIQVL
jgi:hypothetical protein